MGEFILIKDIRQGMKNINVVFIVLDISHPTITKENREVRTFKVADPSACINVSIWDEPGQLLMPGDIVRLMKGYAGLWRNCLTLYTGKSGDLQKINEFCMVFNEQLNMSEPIPPLAQIENNNQAVVGAGAAANNMIPGNSPISNGAILNYHSPSNTQPPANPQQPNSGGSGRGNGGNRFGNGGKPQSKGNQRSKPGHRYGPRSERR